MANHRFLPHSGQNISLGDIRSAVSEAFNFDAKAFDGIFQTVVDANLSTTGRHDTINLVDLLAHDIVEFDGSLSRSDVSLGGGLHFDRKIWDVTASKLGINDFGLSKESKLVTVETAAKARAARVAQDMKINSHFDASPIEMVGTFGTTALYLLTLWDDSIGATYKTWVKAFFGKSKQRRRFSSMSAFELLLIINTEEERIPYLEGFTRQKVLKTAERLGDLTDAVKAVPV